jgi:hypothetical protein
MQKVQSYYQVAYYNPHYISHLCITYHIHILQVYSLQLKQDSKRRRTAKSNQKPTPHPTSTLFTYIYHGSFSIQAKGISNSSEDQLHEYTDLINFVPSVQRLAEKVSELYNLNLAGSSPH